MRRGYSLIEVMIALVVLSATMLISLNIITNTSDSENLNRDILIATELAEEGLQAGLNLFQSNVLKYGEENASECALLLEAVNNPELECSTAVKVREGNNFVYLVIDPTSSSMTWRAEYVGEPLEVDGVLNEAYRLDTMEFESGSDTVTLYTKKADSTTASRYYRLAEVDILSDGSGIQFTSTVAWLRAGGFVTRKQASTIVTY